MSPFPPFETGIYFVAPTPDTTIGFAPLAQGLALPLPIVPFDCVDFSMATPEFPRDFFLLPESSEALFSTKLGKLEKRTLVEPWPMQVLRSDLKGDIERKATELIEEFPGLARSVTATQEWHKLYHYFDAHDLWVDGPKFCFYVILNIATKNESLRESLRWKQAEKTELKNVEIDEFAHWWVENHIDMLRQHPGVRDLTTLLDESDRRNLTEMTVSEVQQLIDGLDFYRQHMVKLPGPPIYLPQRQPAPLHAYPEVDNRMIGPAPTLVRPPLVETQFAPQQIRALPPHFDRRDSTSSRAGRPVVDLQSVHRGPAPFQPTQIYNSSANNQQPLATSSHPQASGQNNNDHNSFRVRGLSETSRGGRGRGCRHHPQNNRKINLNTPNGSPVKNTPQKEPVYVLNQSSPSIAYPSVPNSRIVSEPMPTVPFHPDGRFTNSVAGSPRNHEQLLRHPQRDVYASPTNDRRMQNAHRFSSGPLLGAGDVQYPNMSSMSGMSGRPSNDARVNPLPIGPYQQQVLGLVMQETNETIRYTDNVSRPDRAEQSERTVYFKGFCREHFYNHDLKNLMSECGEVESIACLRNCLTAFIIFVHENSAALAITRYNGETAPWGLKMVAHFPRAGRERSGSNTSYTHQRSMSYGLRENLSHQRGMSIRGSAMNHQDAPAPMTHSLGAQNNRPTDPLHATITEVVQHQSTMESFGQQQQMPLGNIENTISSNKKSGASDAKQQQPGMAQVNSSFKKENATPRNNNGSGPQVPKFKGVKKSSRQNTSVRPTPVGTPVKSRSVLDLKEVDSLESLTTKLQRQDSNPKSASDSQQSTNGGGKKKKHTKRKHVPSSSKSDTAFPTDASWGTMTVPADSTTTTANSSLHGGHSRKPSQSHNGSEIRKSQSSVDLPVNGPTKKNGSKSKNKKALPALDLELETNAESKPDSELKVQTNFPSSGVLAKAEVESPAGSVSVMAEQKHGDKPNTLKHTNGNSNELLTSKKSSRKGDSGSGKTDTVQDGSVSTTKSQDSRSDGGKSDTTVSNANTVTDRTTPSGTNSDIQSPVLDDQDWPSLCGQKSSISSVSDGKQPDSPPKTSLKEVTTEVKKVVKPAVPAVVVPRAFMTRSHPDREGDNDDEDDDDDLGSRAWPFVRRFRGK